MVRRTAGARPVGRAARHPLAVLRTGAGYTHSQYSQLIAATHAALGFGQMAARREKVSRWEAGRAVPERTAQLAIAHIHSIPEEEVLRRGWPDWLHAADGGGRCQLELPWTRASVPEALLDAANGSRAGKREHPAEPATSAEALAQAWLAAAAAPPEPVGAAGRISAEVAVAVRDRLRELHEFEARFAADWLLPAVESELRLIAHLLDDGRAHDSQAQPLLVAAARGAALGGWLARLAGEQAVAQRYYLAGLRAATGAGDLTTAASVLALHLGQYLDLGRPDDALRLADAVRAGTPAERLSPKLDALLHVQTALAHTLRGDDRRRADTLESARRALRRGSAARDSRLLWWVGEDWLDLVTGVTLLDSPRPERALRHFAPLLSGQRSALPPGHAAWFLLHAAEAQLALGQVDAAARTGRAAVVLLGGMASGWVDRLRGALLEHRPVPDVRLFLDLTESRTA